MKEEDLQVAESKTKSVMNLEKELMSSKSLVAAEISSPARDSVQKRVERLEERALSGRKIGIEFERLWAALQVVSEESWKECSVVSGETQHLPVLHLKWWVVVFCSVWEMSENGLEI
eukprot:617215-Rhodomonas_salina.1